MMMIPQHRSVHTKEASLLPHIKSRGLNIGIVEAKLDELNSASSQPKQQHLLGLRNSFENWS
jgi:hypothetical protein